MFHERLTEMITMIGANNGEIAKFAGFDRTNISHMRGGRRTPGPSGAAAQKLAAGLYGFSDSRNELPLLCSLTGCCPDASAEEIRQSIIDWLYEGHTEMPAAAGTGSRGSRRKGARSFRTFGERLDTAMNLAEISNIRLSRLLHTDASQISRYRSGVRMPKENRELAEDMCSLLFERIVRSGKIAGLAEAMNLPAGEIDEELFSSWLYEKADSREETIRATEDLLDLFESYDGGTDEALPEPYAVVPSSVSGDTRTVYIGTAGIREAVLRFLEEAWRRGSKELLLYSDESMNWLSEDRTFILQWMTLMNACVRNGTHISIIHNLDRSAAEMNSAIRSWIPLYMSGNIESFYCRKQRNVRFSHTIFLNPGLSCIEGFHIAGHEAGSVYHYLTSEEETGIYETELRDLMASCPSLIKTGSSRSYSLPAGSDLILDRLPLSTMPVELVKSFGCDALTGIWQQEHAALISRLGSGAVFNCIVPLANDDDLFSGRTQTEYFPEAGLFRYSPEQYAAHVSNIISLMRQYSGFGFFPLPETPYYNVKLMISPESVRITHMLRPSLVFSISQPMLCRAFAEYAESLKEQCRTDRNTLRQRLESRYL